MTTVVARGFTVVAGLLFLLLVTLWVFGIPVIDGLRLMVVGAVGDRFGLSRTAVKTTPLLLCGLAATIAWKAGMYNIGGEGQFICGALAAGTAFTILAPAASAIAGGLGLVVLLISGAVGGASLALLAAWLYVKRGVNVVISTILLNFISLQLLSWAVQGPLQEPEKKLPLSQRLPTAWLLPKFDRQLDLNLGFVIAVVCAIVCTIFLYRTVAGFRLRLVGENLRAARANRVPATAVQLQAMAISGALCGLAGTIEYTGIAGQLGTGFAQGWGFLGIAVALLGGLHPGLCILSALYFGALFAGSENLARFTPAGTTMVYVIQACAVLGFVALAQVQLRKRPALEEA